MIATIELNETELRTIREALTGYYKGAPSSLVDAIDVEIEKLELLDMSDWNDCGDACKL